MLVNSVTSNAPASIGSQKSDRTENDSAMIAIHAKIRNKTFMEWLMNGMGWVPAGRQRGRSIS